VLANVDALMARGGEAQQEASQATGEDQKKLQTEATGKFTAARDALTKLLDRKDLPANLRAEAMFKLGACHYQLDNLPGAVETWTKLGSDLPQESVSANAVINAFIIARDLWQNNQKNDTAIKLFDNASSVLLTKFAPAKIGDDPVSLHWHTRGSFLRQLNRHTEAVEAFDQFVKLNPRNPLIPDALYQSLISRQALLAGVEGSDRTKVAEATLAAANAAITALEAAAKASRGEQASAQLYQAGDATLRKAEVLTGGLNQYAQAKVLLGDFDGKFKQFPDLLRAKREMSISLMMSMGQAADALSEIRQLMAQFPNEGGALINGVLLAVNKQIDDLLLVGRKDDAIKLAGVGVELSTFLLDWATKQPEYREPAKLLPFQIMNTRQLVMAQRYQDALDIYDQIITTDAGKTNFDVIYGRARALHKLGRNEEALPLVNMLLRLGETKQGQDEWWDTWMMRVTILDTQFEAQTNGENKDPVKAKKTSATIFTSIEKLKLIDKELGGSKFRDRFQQLQNKHFPK
jgi:tetratricopeptide (TPR) repeat protein